MAHSDWLWELRPCAFKFVKLQSAGYHWLVFSNTRCFACIVWFTLYRKLHVGTYCVVFLIIVFVRSIGQGLTFGSWSGNWSNLQLISHWSECVVNEKCMGTCPRMYSRLRLHWLHGFFMHDINSVKDAATYLYTTKDNSFSWPKLSLRLLDK